MKITEGKIVEHLLSEYPIAEMNDERQRNALVATLLNGEKRMVEFEKSVVPAEVVGKYIIVEHSFPTPGIPAAKHYAEPLGEYESYNDAVKDFYLKAEKAINSAQAEDEVKEIMLVGEFKDRKLDFNYKGEPDINTGITMGSTLTKLDTAIIKNYVAKDPVDCNEPVIIKDKLYVHLDRQSASLKFEQNFFERNELDVGFWKINKRDRAKDMVDLDEGKLLKKKRTNMDTEKWVNENDSLLPKKSENKGKGKGLG